MKRFVLAVVGGFVVVVGLLAVAGAILRATSDAEPQVAEPFEDSYCARLSEGIGVKVPGGPLQEISSDGPDTIVSCVIAPSGETFQLTVVTLESGSTADRSRDERLESSLDSACGVVLATPADGECSAKINAGAQVPEGDFMAFVTDDGSAVVSITRSGLRAGESLPFSLEPLRSLLRSDGRP